MLPLVIVALSMAPLDTSHVQTASAVHAPLPAAAASAVAAPTVAAGPIAPAAPESPTLPVGPIAPAAPAPRASSAAPTVAAGPIAPAAPAPSAFPAPGASTMLRVRPAAYTLAVPADTPETPPLIEYSDAYGTRLTIHKIASYATIPLFVGQYISGNELIQKGGAAPSWARRAHGPLAAALAGLFAVNTVTGVWNLWDSRKDPEGRKWRTAHAVLMLVADAGFVATGLVANEAGYGSGQTLHKDLAIGSIGAALASYLMMLPPLRRD